MGKDATVYYGKVDFKFVNSTQYPLMIRTVIEENNLILSLFENRN